MMFFRIVLRRGYKTLIPNTKLKKLLTLTGALTLLFGFYTHFNGAMMDSSDVRCIYNKKGPPCSPDVDRKVHDRSKRESLATVEKNVSEARKWLKFGPITKVEHRSNFRVAYMRSECDNFYHVREYDPEVDGQALWALRNLMAGAYSNDEYNFTIFTVMKVGSWHWNQIMEDLHQKSSSDFRRVNPKPLTSLRAASESLYLKRLKTHYKVVFVRHPLARVVSAWRDKFVEHHSAWYRPWARRMVRMFRKNATMAELQRPTPSILEFVRYITESGEDEVHWKPVWRFYRPCRLRFDFVGRLETVREDAAFVLSKLGVLNDITYRSRSTKRNPTDLGLVRSVLATLPLEVFERLVRKYEEDFRLFGYHRPSNASDIKLWAEHGDIKREEQSG